MYKFRLTAATVPYALAILLTVWMVPAATQVATVAYHFSKTDFTDLPCGVCSLDINIILEESLISPGGRWDSM